MALSQIETQQVSTPGAEPEVSAWPRVGPRAGSREVGTERLNAARGIIVGLGIGLTCWLAIGAALWAWMA